MSAHLVWDVFAFRHPTKSSSSERSAVTDFIALHSALSRAESKDPDDAGSVDAGQSLFNRLMAQQASFAHRSGVQRSFTYLDMEDDYRARKDYPVTFKCGIFVAGKLRTASANKDRRGPSASRHKASVLCDRSAVRFASTARRGRQDDGFVESLKTLAGCAKHRKIKKVTGSQDDGCAVIGRLMNNAYTL